MKFVVIGRNSVIYNSVRIRFESISDELIELNHTQLDTYSGNLLGADKVFLFAIDKKDEEKTKLLTEKAVALCNSFKCELILISSAICYVDFLTKSLSYSRLKHVQEQIVVNHSMRYKILRLGYFKVGCDLPYIKKIGNLVLIFGNKNSVLPSFDEDLFFDTVVLSNPNRLYPIYSVITKYQETKYCYPEKKILCIPRVCGFLFLMLSKVLRLLGLINMSNKIARPFYGEVSFT